MIYKNHRGSNTEGVPANGASARKSSDAPLARLSVCRKCARAYFSSILWFNVLKLEEVLRRIRESTLLNV